MITRWILPVAFVVIGVMILTGNLLQQIPQGTGLRTVMGIVVILLGVHRFVVSRAPKSQERRFGGEHRRPWEDS
ncbi:MAG: hypothetical protein KDB65_02790 [Calditrichaeota bacterium]|nr:hypothetical protein [Calditrichota bacterium]MCB9367950.1 hypothetical protein [Calditrichota bacterium]